MLADACRHGIFANHPGHYLIRVVDAMQPAKHLLGDQSLPKDNPRPLRAVFLNYLLDCLPAAGLRIVDNQVDQLCVRTCLARNVDLAEYTNLTPQDLARRARLNSPADQRTLLELYGLFASEYDYRSVDINQIPYGDFAVRFAQAQTSHLQHNYGAVQSLEGLLAILHPQGFILANDYGQTQLGQGDDIEHQRFSHATFIGINFPLLKAYFADAGNCQWVEPLEDSGSIHSRILGHSIGAQTSKFFAERFSKAAQDRLQEPLGMARAMIQAGRFEGALTAYHKALERQPNNWILMNEIALFLTFTIGKPVSGIAMAKVALELNPACSSELWNTLGDAYFQWGKVPESKNAYQRALKINPSDVRARFNMAFVYQQEKNYRAALTVIAEAMNLDETGEYLERLGKKQAEILGQLANRNRLKYFLLANRVSKRPQGQDTQERPKPITIDPVPKEPG
jgi:tetratricopeptide (TPR) repeat protein